MTPEQLPEDSEQLLQKEAEIDVLVREIEALVMGNDIELLRMAVKVATSLGHYRHENGEIIGETVRDQIRRQLTDETTR